MASLALLEGGPNGERRPSREMDDSFIPPEAATLYLETERDQWKSIKNALRSMKNDLKPIKIP